MRFRQLGNTDEELPLIGQGTWKLELADLATARRALLTGIDAGMTHLDTAEDYGQGRVEELLAGLVAPRRDRLFLTSKVHPDHATRACDVLAACHRSCRRLGVDHLDLYLLHWPGHAVLPEAVAAFRTLEQQGTIRYWGVSNFGPRDLDRLHQHAQRGEAVCNQVFYHLAERRIEHQVLPRGGQASMSTVAYSPLGSSGFPPPDHRGNDVLRAIARRHDASTAQVALAWLARHDSVLLLPRSYNTEHTLANAAAAELNLSADDVRALDTAYPRAPDTGHTPTL
ncbi:aldo/keto reductase [Streptomyces xanthochromogenes]|uniref:aldo/keto reductase n=1 Tax=Streptomyces xanthochromogenes TaxID=67384 RepID=UPI003816E793